MRLIEGHDDTRLVHARPTIVRRRPARFVAEVEAEIGQLYLGTQEEPIPLRLLTILRSGVCSSKA
jgi:hypothetical protein